MSERDKLQFKRAAGIIVVLIGLMIAYVGIGTAINANKQIERLDQMILK